MSFLRIITVTLISTFPLSQSHSLYGGGRLDMTCNMTIEERIQYKYVCYSDLTMLYDIFLYVILLLYCGALVHVLRFCYWTWRMKKNSDDDPNNVSGSKVKRCSTIKSMALMEVSSIIYTLNIFAASIKIFWTITIWNGRTPYALMFGQGVDAILLKVAQISMCVQLVLLILVFQDIINASKKMVKSPASSVIKTRRKLVFRVFATIIFLVLLALVDIYNWCRAAVSQSYFSPTLNAISLYGFALVTLVLCASGFMYSYKISKMLRKPLLEVGVDSSRTSSQIKSTQNRTSGVMWGSNDKKDTGKNDEVLKDDKITSRSVNEVSNQNKRNSMASDRIATSSNVNNKSSSSSSESFKRIQQSVTRISILGATAIISIIIGVSPFSYKPLVKLLGFWAPLHICEGLLLFFLVDASSQKVRAWINKERLLQQGKHIKAKSTVESPSAAVSVSASGASTRGGSRRERGKSDNSQKRKKSERESRVISKDSSHNDDGTEESSTVSTTGGNHMVSTTNKKNSIAPLIQTVS